MCNNNQQLLLCPSLFFDKSGIRGKDIGQPSSTYSMAFILTHNKNLQGKRKASDLHSNANNNHSGAYLHVSTYRWCCNEYSNAACCLPAFAYCPSFLSAASFLMTFYHSILQLLFHISKISIITWLSSLRSLLNYGS